MTKTQKPPLNVLSDIEVQRLDHLGLVAGAIDTLKLVERIDKRLPICIAVTATLPMGNALKR